MGNALTFIHHGIVRTNQGWKNLGFLEKVFRF